jgi:RND superfamily putative drug exporter
VAALLPPLLGGLAIVGTFFFLRLVATVTDLSVFALNLTTGLGLGLAIDYSLFIVSRYREEAARDGFGLEALRRTIQTAGRTVLFSAITVAVAVAALTIFPQRFLYSMGIAGAIVALLAATLALTVLPALLAVLGPHVNALSPRRLRHAADRDARPARSGAWYGLAQFVTRRPAQVALATAAVLVALGLPFTQIRFITADARVLAQTTSAHQVQSALDTQFPPNRTTPVEVVVALPASSSEIRALAERIADLQDVSAVAPAQPAARETSLLEVAPVHGPLTGSTEQLVREVRAIRTPYYLGVAGQTASYLDLEHSLGAHLPAALAVVVAATLIVLFLMTGSVLLPFKAIAMNALNLSAVFGILVLIFQHGNLQGLLGYHGVGALDATQPILLFAIGFGLATDYGVFLLARIKEAHDAGAPNSEAVALGLERTGRIVTAAAALFAVAVSAFATSQIVFIKELGIGTALTVLLDASLIRALLVPSLMALLGPLNWWAPRPLRWLHERTGLREGAPEAA